MKTETYKSLGLNAAIQVPASEKEFNENAKKEGACLAEANNNIVYRSVLAELRDLFLHGREANAEQKITAFKGVEQTTGIKRSLKPSGRKDAKGVEIMVYKETEADYFKRVCLEKKVEASHFQPLMDEAVKLVKFDASAPEHKPAQPKKLADKYKETASAILKGKHLKDFLADVKEALGREWVATGEEAKDVEALGWIVKDLASYREKQVLTKMVNGK